METFLRFVAGVGISVAYVVVANVVGAAVASAVPESGPICAWVAFLGWFGIIVFVFRKEQRWIGYGIIAAPFIALLLVTVSCFVAIGVGGSASAV